jgi:hypothetical protein
MVGRAHRSASQAAPSQTLAPEGHEDLQSLYGNGFVQGLSPELRMRFERSLGVDLSDVRLHLGDDAAQHTAAVGADALAFGQDILFGEDQADFDSREGQLLLAHEVAHTVQQQGQTPYAQHHEPGAPADEAEVKADSAALGMVSGERVEIDEVSPYTGELVPLAPRSTRLEIDTQNPYAPPKPPKPRLTQPTQIKGPLGPMMVYPDDYAGTLPKGAVRQSQHEKMEGIITGIEDGSSQLSIDTSNFTEGIDPEKDPQAYQKAKAEGEAFRKQHMSYLKDLVKTPTGMTLLDELGHSKHKTKITHGTRNHCDDVDPSGADLVPRRDSHGQQVGTRPGDGTDTVVVINPDDKTFFDPIRDRKEEPWQTERQRYGFYHELVHAYHSTRGETIPGTKYRGPALTEYQTVGKAKADAKDYEAGTYPDEEVSENAIRRDFGKPERPYY